MREIATGDSFAILLPNGEDVCLDQVKTVMAWHYKQYQDEQNPLDREAYATAECAAMKAKAGLWNDPHPVQPQDFRHSTNSPLLFDANGCRRSSEPTSGPVVGNARSHIFEWPACPYYSAISPNNQVPFPSPQAAEAAGYRPAKTVRKSTQGRALTGGCPSRWIVLGNGERDAPPAGA
jgi:hypothetical protein